MASSSSSTSQAGPVFPPALFKDFPLEPILSDLVVESYEGDRDDYDRFDGPGMAKFRNGDEYTGEFRGGLMNGHGKYTWKDGTMYEGSFESNEIRGEGKYTWCDGSTYEGSVRKGLRDGQGWFKAAGGSPKYEGQWMDGKRQGHGVLCYDADGKCRYEGEWKANLRDGHGKMLYLSGNTYEGEWRRDKKNGFGVMHWFNLRERYSGHWADDKQSGFGEHIWMDDKPSEASLGLMKQMCNMYRGEWSGGERNGEGTFFYSNGARYSGQWKANRKEGFGIFIFEDGHMYEGTFTNDRMAEPPTGAGPRNEEALQLQLYVDVVDALPSAACDVHAEIHKLEKLALQHNTDLKRLYKMYSTGAATTTTGTPPLENCFTMSIREFKRFCKDCKLMGDLLTPITIDRILYKMRRHHFLQIQSILSRHARAADKSSSSTSSSTSSLSSLSKPEVSTWIPVYDEQAQLQKNREDVLSLLFREFFEALVRVAHFLYTNEAPELSLHGATKKLLQDKVIPYLIVPQQQSPQPTTLNPSKSNSNIAASQQPTTTPGPPTPTPLPEPAKSQGVVLEDTLLTALFQRYSQSQPSGGYFTRRDFIKLIRDCRMLVPDMITIDDIVQALKALNHQYGRSSFLEDPGSDLTELDCKMAMEEFKESIFALAEEITKKERLRDITSSSNFLLTETPPSSFGAKATTLLTRIKELGETAPPQPMAE